MQNKFFCITFLSLFILSSCDSNRVFDEYKSVPNQWNKDRILEFNFTPPDSTNAYNLFVNIRNTSDYQYSNLFLIVDLQFPHGKTLTDTLEYEMAKPNGELLGEGFTDLKENKLWYKGYEKPFVFEEKGTYLIKIQHAMRNNGDVNGVSDLQGITDVGFRVESTSTN